jgi:hypothetical protein
VYALAITALVALLRPVRRALRESRRGKALQENEWRRIAIRCLRLGQYWSTITFSVWMVAGAAVPIWVHIISYPDSTIPVPYFAQFIASQLVFAIMAATMTYFFVTYVSAL